MKKYTFVLSAILLVALLFLTGGTGPGGDPHVTHLFEVEIDGLTAGRFSEFSGIGISQEVVEIDEGGEDRLIHKKPGMVRYDDITLKRTYVAESDLNNWIEKARFGGGEEPLSKTVTIILYQIGKDGKTEKEVRRWTCMSAFPKSWRITSLDGKENDVLTEEIVLVIDYFEES